MTTAKEPNIWRQMLAALREAHQQLPEGPAKDKTARAIRAAQSGTPPAEPDAEILQALIHGSKARIELAAEVAGVTPEYCITGDNGVTFFMSAGPTLLEAVARTLNIDPGDIARWDDLDEADRSAWGSIAAGNLQWAIDGEIQDPHYIDMLNEEIPGILLRLMAPGSRIP